MSVKKSLVKPKNLLRDLANLLNQRKEVKLKEENCPKCNGAGVQTARLIAFPYYPFPTEPIVVTCPLCGGEKQFLMIEFPNNITYSRKFNPNYFNKVHLLEIEIKKIHAEIELFPDGFVVFQAKMGDETYSYNQMREDYHMNGSVVQSLPKEIQTLLDYLEKQIRELSGIRIKKTHCF